MQARLPQRYLPRPDRDELLGVLGDDAIRVMKPGDIIVQEMRAAARAAMKNAYCRYSKFRVGAAVLNAAGETFAWSRLETGCSWMTEGARRDRRFQRTVDRRA